LHLGDILWGNIGAADRLDFTAIGPAVNLVSRLEGPCKPLRKTVLVSGALAAETKTPLIAGAVLRPPSSIRVATSHPSSARAITAMFRNLRSVARQVRPSLGLTLFLVPLS
jgi:class 3 adenylate cyclase